jgi:hypothetical protein
MNAAEVTPVLDVHPPHEPVHGWRDFILHLTTITIGLLIALSLEGLVEWQHHRHLVHDAEAGLQTEIRGNAKEMQSALDGLHKEQDDLSKDVAYLKLIKQTHSMPSKGSLSIGFGIRDFEDVSWRTAQVSTAISYMSYDLAQEYSDIYLSQSHLADSEKQAARDTIIALGPFLNTDKDGPAQTAEEAQALIDKIQVLQGQLLLVDSFMKGLDAEYKKFLSAHPG